MVKDMKNIFDHWAGRTTMHGMGSVASAGSFKSKLFWSGVCVGSMGMFVYMLFRLVIQYLEYGVNVKVEEVSGRLLLQTFSSMIIPIVRGGRVLENVDKYHNFFHLK